jgi:hypothetical protein
VDLIPEKANADMKDILDAEKGTVIKIVKTTCRVK